MFVKAQTWIYEDAQRLQPQLNNMRQHLHRQDWYVVLAALMVTRSCVSSANWW